MLIGNRGKYVGMVLGITFAALLIGQQSGVPGGAWLCGSIRGRPVREGVPQIAGRGVANRTETVGIETIAVTK